MAIRIIREDGDEILRKKSREVEEVHDKIREIHKIFKLNFSYFSSGVTYCNVPGIILSTNSTPSK